MSEEKKEVVEIEEPRKWTFVNYFKGIKKFKWWVIGFSVAGAAAGFLSFKFALNPARKKLTATYTLQLPEMVVAKEENKSNDVIRLVDGSTFNPFSITTRSNLQAIKDSNAAYKKINVDKIVENGGISIEREVIVVKQGETETNYIDYKVSAKASQFPSDKIGQSFLYDVLNSATVIAGNAIDNYSVADAFTENFDSLAYERQIAQMETQYESITKTFTNLSKKFDKSTVASADGKKLYEVENAVKGHFAVSGNESFIDNLDGALYSNQYIDYDPARKDEIITAVKNLCFEYNEAKAKKTDEIAIYEAQIAQLNATLIVSQDTELTDKIAELSDKIATTKLEIKEIERALTKNGWKDGENWYDAVTDKTVLGRITANDATWIAECAAFKAKIADYKAKLVADRNVTSEAFRYCYKANQNQVIIQNGGYIKVEGAISSIIGLAAGLLVGFAASSLITAAIYIYKKED